MQNGVNFKRNLVLRIKQTRRLVLLRLIGVGILLFPLWIFVLIWSLFCAYRWRNLSVCRKFIKRHHLAFEDLDPSTLRVQQISGGLNNLNEIWRIRSTTGQDMEYCVKVFLPLGSLWAKVNAMASAFPYVHAGSIQERFTVDLMSRAQLAEKGIFVPQLVAFGAQESVMVTEHLKGLVVDDVLKAIEVKGVLSDDDLTVIRECGRGLGRIHAEGFSLIDTQPVNCIWVPEDKQVCFLDMEFCTRADYRVWDAAFFLMSVIIRLPENLVTAARNAFIEGYQSERPIDWHTIDRLDRQLKQYIPVFLTILDIRQFSPGGLFRELWR
jgi:tRNA A-37 threonylcarbamoyl transferase component Bud32